MNNTAGLQKEKHTVQYSVVIPVFNEEDSLPKLFSLINNTMNKLGSTWEAILVNDGSLDNSLGVLKNIATHSGHLVILDLRKHCGQSTAFQAGFDHARGEIIITMDGDLQNDPEEIPRLLDKMGKGFDVVCGWRYPRNDPWLKIVSAGFATALRRSITKEKTHDLGCAFRAFRKESIKNVYLSAKMHNFFTLIMLKLGYKIGEVKIKHYRRRFGKSKYNIRNRLWEGVKDLVHIQLFGISALMKNKPSYGIKEVIRK